MEFYEHLIQFAEKSPGGVVVCTIVESEGSAPRHVGTKMAVNEDGDILETIGGGSLEVLVIRKARSYLKKGSSSLEHFDLAALEDASPMMCGGSVRIFFEVLQKPLQLYLFGAGHVGKALAPLLKHLPFRIVVADHRPEMLEEPAFAGCEKVITDFENLVSRLTPLPGAYAVIATPSHSYDFACLEQLISQPLGYLGVIASKKKRGKFFSALREKGVPEDALKRIASPIGMDIGSESPYEIGLSITAEIVATLRKAESGKPFKK